MNEIITAVEGFAIPDALKGSKIAQIAILVPDLKEAVAKWSLLLGNSEWAIYTYHSGNVSDLTYREMPGKFKMRLALCGSGPQIELIESLEGPSIYEDFIRTHGYGLHHLGILVDSIKDTVQQMTDQGFKVTQSGRGYGLDGDGGFAYFNEDSTNGVILETIEVPRRRRPSEQL